MNDLIIRVFAFIGFCATFGIIVSLIIMIKEAIRDFIDEKKWNYKYKHRFDKPPTAQCYCKDCIYLSPYKKECPYMKGSVADNCFCWRADPMKRDPEKNRCEQ